MVVVQSERSSEIRRALHWFARDIARAIHNTIERAEGLHCCICEFAVSRVRIIASELGMTRESFSRALSALQHDGVSVQGDTIRILDAERLAAISALDPLIDEDWSISPLLHDRR